MKVLIITLFVFVTNFVSSSVLADDKNKEELKNAVLKFTNKNNADLTISTLEYIISEIKKEALEPNMEQKSVVQPKSIRGINCKRNKGIDDCSDDQIKTIEEACETFPQICEVRGSIDLYEPNYVMHSWSNHDDNALEVQYSGRYNIRKISCVKDNEEGLYIDYKCVEETEITEKNKPVQSEIFFSLTGRYDFYAFSDEDSNNRISEPVINRFFNPAVHIKFIYPTSSKLEFVDFSFEHLSNGQTGKFKDIEFTAGEGKNYEASDSNSISMFFPSISAQLILIEEDSMKYKVFARAILDYWGAELDIYSEVGEKIGKDEFPGYHRYKIGTILESDDKWLLELSATGHKKTSFDALLAFPLIKIPGVSLIPIFTSDEIGNLLLSYHNGYLSRLSNYDLKEQTFGIGIGVAF